MEHKFPQIKPHPFSKVFRPRTPADAIDLISKLLEYTPGERMTAIEAMTHPFFDELRNEGGKLPNERPYPPLFKYVLNLGEPESQPHHFFTSQLYQGRAKCEAGAEREAGTGVVASTIEGRWDRLRHFRSVLDWQWLWKTKKTTPD